MESSVTAVVVTYDAGPPLGECLDSLGDTPVLVVDNGAVPLSLPGNRVLRTGRNLGFAGAASASRVHPSYDARNRLLTRAKHAPVHVAAREILRFPLTTASLFARRRDAAELRTRTGAYLSFLRLLPRMLRRRAGSPRS